MKEKKGEEVGQDKVRGRREKEEWVGGGRPFSCPLQQLLLHELTSQVLSTFLGQPSVHFLQPHLSKHSPVPYAVKIFHPLDSFPL